jgi:hypothetical protein
VFQGGGPVSVDRVTVDRARPVPPPSALPTR